MKNLKNLFFILLISIFLIFIPIISNAASGPNIKVKVEANYKYAFEVLKLVNKERTKVGLSKLTMDKDLLDAAMLRAAEQVILRDHIRPDGTFCFTAEDKMYAENIAWGFSKASGAMNWWMNSPGHKFNILTSGYQTIGVGCVKYKGTYYWVQAFGISKDKSAVVTKPKSTKKVSYNVNLATTNVKIKYSGSTTIKESKYRKKGYSPTLKLKTSAYTVTPNTNSFKYSSSDQSIFIVNSKGVITPVFAGKATLTIKLKNSNIKIKKQIKVTGDNKVKNVKYSKRKSNQVTLKWNKVTGATGYKIYKLNPNTNKYEYVTTTKNTNATIKKLTKKTKYKFKIRAYKKINGKKYNGLYSSVLTVKTK